MNGRGGFLLADVLIAVGVLSAVGLAASQTAGVVERGRRRATLDQAVAACAEERLAALLMNQQNPVLCDGGVQTDESAQPVNGDWDEVTFSFTKDGGAAARFTTLRHAR